MEFLSGINSTKPLLALLSLSQAEVLGVHFGTVDEREPRGLKSDSVSAARWQESNREMLINDDSVCLLVAGGTGEDAVPQHRSHAAPKPRGEGTDKTFPSIPVLLRLICRDPSHLRLGFILPPCSADERAAPSDVGAAAGVRERKGRRSDCAYPLRDRETKDLKKMKCYYTYVRIQVGSENGSQGSPPV